MQTLNDLVIEYKQTNLPLFLDKIFKELKKIIKDKSEFIYYKKWYPLNLYNKCKYCKDCKNNIESKNRINELKRKKTCEDCKKCICNKRYFNLSQNHLCDLQDVNSDLVAEIIRLINNFDPTRGEFKTYLISSLWNWRPSFLTTGFVENVNYSPLVKETESGETYVVDAVDNNSTKKIKSKLNVEDIFSVCHSDVERKLCELYLMNPNLSQKEIALKLHTTQQTISKAIIKLRKKLKRRGYNK